MLKVLFKCVDKRHNTFLIRLHKPLKTTNVSIDIDPLANAADIDPNLFKWLDECEMTRGSRIIIALLLL